MVCVYVFNVETITYCRLNTNNDGKRKNFSIFILDYDNISSLSMERLSPSDRCAQNLVSVCPSDKCRFF